MQLKGNKDDFSPLSSETLSWRKAKNIVLSGESNDVENEPGFDGLEDAPYPICGVLGTPKEYIIYSTNNTDNEIAVVRGGVYTVIINSQLLSLNTDNPIRGSFRYMFNGNLVIAWVDGVQTGHNKPRILNVDCLPFELDINNDFVNADDINLLNIFPNYTVPVINVREIRDTGGNLATGSYSIFTAYELSDGSITSWSALSNPVPIVLSNDGDTFVEYDGDPADQFSTKSIVIDFSNLDNSYEFIIIGISTSIAQEIQTYRVTKIAIQQADSVEYVLTTLLDAELIDLGSVLVSNAIYDGAEAIDVINDRLVLAHVKEIRDLDYQKYANNIKVKWRKQTVVSLNTINKTFKEGTVVYNKKGFQGDEVYALYIALVLKNGERTKAYHIPGRSAIALPYTDNNYLENALLTELGPDNYNYINRLYAQELSDTAKAHEIYDTARIDRRMGYWENQTEIYPDTDDFDVVDSGGVIGNIRSAKVRHHKMPSLKKLSDWGIPHVTRNTVSTNLSREFHILVDDHVSQPSEVDSCRNIKFRYFDTAYCVPSLITDKALNGHNANWVLSFDDDELVFYCRSMATQTVDLIIDFDFNIISGAINVISVFRLEQYSQDGVLLATHAAENVGGVVPSALNVSVGINDIDVSVYDYFKIRFAHTAPTVEFTSDHNGTDGELVPPSSSRANPVIKIVPSAVTNTYDFSQSEIDTTVLGIALEDIYFPPEIKAEIQGFEILYAKRDANNRLIFDQSILTTFTDNRIDSNSIINTGEDDFRFHGFDSLKTKPGNFPAYFKQQLYGFALDETDLLVNNNYNFLTSNETFGNGYKGAFQLRILDELLYVPRNTTGYINNANSEEILWGKFNENMRFKPVYSHRFAWSRGDNNLLVNVILNPYGTIGNLMYYKNDIYKDFYNQQLVRTGKIYFINDNDTYEVKNENGGDIFINGHGFERRSAGNTYFTYIPVESAANIGLRFDDVNNNIQSYPKEDDLALVDDSLYLYNEDYSQLNYLKSAFPYNPSTDCVAIQDIFPSKIALSIPSTREEYELTWRVFLINDYYEMPKKRGNIVAVCAFGDRLMIHLEHGLYVTAARATINVGAENANIGYGEIFEYEPKEVLNDAIGELGLADKFGFVLCRHGYLFVSSNEGFIVQYDGAVKILSNEGRRVFFKDNLPKANSTSDNPMGVGGFTVGFDTVYNRLLVTKNKTSEPEREFTVSYDFGRKMWVCEHDYIPNLYFRTSQRLYSVRNNINGNEYKIYGHNSKTELKRGQFYEDERFGSYIDLLFNSPDAGTFVLQAIQWISEVYNSARGASPQDTITHITIYTDTQCTGRIPIDGDYVPWFDNNVAFDKGEWRFNEIRDFVIDPTVFLINDDGEVNTTNINLLKNWFDLSEIISKFIIVRLEYTTNTPRTFRLLDVKPIAIKTL